MKVWYNGGMLEIQSKLVITLRLGCPTQLGGGFTFGE